MKIKPPFALFFLKLKKTNLLLLSMTFGLCFSINSVAQIDNAKKIAPIINYLISSDISSEMSLEEASRFLTQTTFGPIYEDVVALSNQSYERWLDEQMTMPQTRTIDFVESQNWIINYPLILARSADSALLHTMMNAQDQLRQRVAYALSQIFVVSRNVNNGLQERPLYYLDYYDMLAENAFGNYRDLLGKVTTNSVMGFYLSSALNAPANTQVGPVNHPASFFVTSPDENYAREVMQLFSIGLFELNTDGTFVFNNGELVPTYTQETIENFARVFTGWNYQSAGTSVFFNLGVPGDTRPMISFEPFHDQNPKVLLNGQVLPANQGAVKDLNDALDNIFNHNNVAPFISKLLIQHLVTSNPTPNYVKRVANVFNGLTANGRANPELERGDLGAVIKAILLDTEARNGHRTLPRQFGKFKEPFIRQLSMWRGLNARRRTDNNNLLTAYNNMFSVRLRQQPLRARSVFNFYQADFSPAGVFTDEQLLAPESQLLDTESVIGIASTFEEYVQRHHDDASNDFASSSTGILIDTDNFQALISDDFNPDKLIERLNLIFMAGAMSDEMKQVLRDVHDPDFYVVENKWRIVIDLANIILLSPQYSVQK